MPTIIDWPLQVLIPSKIGLDLDWYTRSGGAALNGVEQIASPLSSQWRMSLEFPTVDETKVRVFRAVKTDLRGRFGWVRFPIFDTYRVSLTAAGWPVSDPVPFSDDAFFSDDSGFAAPDIYTTAAVAGDRADEEITLEVASINDALGVGHYISINDYLHLTVGYGAKVGDNRTFRIAPPLREDVALGATVKVGRPTMLCRLTDDASGALSLDMGRWARPTMSFVEVLTRES